jgi:hypothetical protein
MWSCRAQASTTRANLPCSNSSSKPISMRTRASTRIGSQDPRRRHRLQREEPGQGAVVLRSGSSHGIREKGNVDRPNISGSARQRSQNFPGGRHRPRAREESTDRAHRPHGQCRLDNGPHQWGSRSRRELDTGGRGRLSQCDGSGRLCRRSSDRCEFLWNCVERAGAHQAGVRVRAKHSTSQNTPPRCDRRHSHNHKIVYLTMDTSISALAFVKMSRHLKNRQTRRRGDDLKDKAVSYLRER